VASTVFRRRFRRVIAFKPSASGAGALDQEKVLDP